jgi:hypothetical protein
MKQSILVNLHSFVDVITNSSGELFVCDTEKSLETVKSLLHEMLDLYNKCNEGKAQPFDEVFGRISVISKDDKEAAKELMLTIGSYKGYYHSTDEVFATFPSYEDEKYKLEPDKQYSQTDFKAYQKDEEKWVEDNVDKFLEKYGGRITIHSASDNSIPYSLFEMIDSAFNGYHIHLG